jgi:hypothetical protein
MTRQQIKNHELSVGDFVRMGHATTHENPVWEVIDIEYNDKFISAVVTLKLVAGVYYYYGRKKNNVPTKYGPGFVISRRATQLMKIDIIEEES